MKTDNQKIFKFAPNGLVILGPRKEIGEGVIAALFICRTQIFFKNRFARKTYRLKHDFHLQKKASVKTKAFAIYFFFFLEVFFLGFALDLAFAFDLDFLDFETFAFG